MDEAIEHAMAAQDYATALELVQQTAEALLRRSEVSTLIARVQALPQDLVRQQPDLSLDFAWAQMLNGASWEIVKSYLPQDSGDDNHVARKVATIHAFLALMQGDLRQARRLSRQALAAFGPDEPFWRSQAAWILSVTYQPEFGIK